MIKGLDRETRSRRFIAELLCVFACFYAFLFAQIAAGRNHRIARVEEHAHRRPCVGLCDGYLRKSRDKRKQRTKELVALGRLDSRSQAASGRVTLVLPPLLG